MVENNDRLIFTKLADTLSDSLKNHNDSTNRVCQPCASSDCGLTLAPTFNTVALCYKNAKRL